MNDQISFVDMEYANRKKKTKREEFLEEMDRIIPWSEWVQLISPYYPDGKRGRPVRGIETMLRMYLCRTGSIFPMQESKIRSMTATL
jgi:hypothetical protein